MIPIGGYFESECGSFELKGGSCELNGEHFELEGGNQVKFLHSSLWSYQSARAALFHLLSSLLSPKQAIDTLWLPKYICRSIYQVAEQLGISTQFYSINEDFEVESDIALKPHDAIFFVNYFGIHEQSEAALLARFPSEQVILDYSQAFYQQPRRDVLATIYSPRKFVGVPDGGFLATSKPLCYEALPEDSHSIDRSRHLVSRLNGDIEVGYREFQVAEQSLDDPTPVKMSKLTRTLLSQVSYNSIKERRRANFTYLNQQLGNMNQLKPALKDQVPLCYPLLVDATLTDITTLRARLLQEKVFIPCYWPELKDQNGLNDFEKKLVSNLLAIPCDQRYTPDQLVRIVDIVREVVDEH